MANKVSYYVSIFTQKLLAGFTHVKIVQYRCYYQSACLAGLAAGAKTYFICLFCHGQLH